MQHNLSFIGTLDKNLHTLKAVNFSQNKKKFTFLSN